MNAYPHRPTHLAACALLLACAPLVLAAAPPPATAPAKPAAPLAAAAAPAADAALPAAPLPPPPPGVLDSEPLKPGEFAWQPQMATDGPLLVVVNIREQMAYVYRNGLRIGRSTVSTGKTGHETPTGVFTILQKNREHYSNLYNNAPMPFMQRLTWDGVALHAGKLPGYPASHGCVRLPYAFSELLFGATTTGVTVVIANDTGVAPTVVADTMLASSPLAAKVEAAWEGAWTWTPERATDGMLTIVVSTSDRTIHVLRNGVEIGRARVSLSGPPPAGTTTYVLLDGRSEFASKIVPGRPALRWQAVGDGAQPDREEPLAGDFASRVNVPADFTQKVYDLLRPGASVVITSEPLRRAEAGSPLTVLRADESAEAAAAPRGPVAPVSAAAPALPVN